MGLGFNTQTDSNDSSSGSTQNSSSSSSGSSSGYPKLKEVVPYLVVYEDEDGFLQYRTHPQNMFIVRRKKYKSDRWSIYATPEEVKRFWMTRHEFKMHSQRVESHAGKDLMSIMQDDPEKALRALRQAANEYDTSKADSHQTKTCYICGEEHHAALGDYYRIQNLAVCESHSVEDLKHADLL